MIFTLVAFSWVVVLIIMKCRERQFGCAAGKPFQTHCEGSVRSQLSSGRYTETEENDSSLDSGSNQGSIAGTNIDSVEGSVTGTVTGQVIQPSALVANRSRARRTRFVFLMFGISAIVSIVMLMIFSFARIKESIQFTESAMMATQEIIDQVQSSLRSVESAGQYAIQVVSTTDFDLLTLCPNASKVGEELGIDLEVLAEEAQNDFKVLQMIIESNLTTFNNTLQNIQRIKDDVDIDLENAQRYSWIIPELFLGVTIVTTISMLGVTLAWRGKSGNTFQKGMSYVTLPMLVTFSLVCWILTMGAAAGAIFTGDGCTAAGKLGGPDATVVDILEQSDLDKNGTAYRMIYAYTNACRGESPTNTLESLEELLQSTVNDIWGKMSTLDSLGRDNIAKACGIEAGDKVDDFFEGTRQLAKSLSTIRKAIDSTIGTLECSNIHPIYVDVIHETVCEDVAIGFNIAFILLLVIFICLMVLITLRAAWLHQGNTARDCDKVYAENEVAENMVLDEYEEYLTYISKYKHEWEDYEGIDTAIETPEATRALAPESEESVVRQLSNDEDVYTDEEYDVRESECESSAAESSLPDDLSFPSLQITPSVTEAAAGIMVVPYLLPRTYSDEDQDREAFEIISPRAKCSNGIPWTIHTTPHDREADSDNGVRVMGRQLGDFGDRNPATMSVKDIEKGEENVEERRSPRRFTYPKHDPRLSADADSIVDKIMKSFDAPSGEDDDDDHIETMYGVRLRTKESIEAELDRHYGRASGDWECRDPPPPPEPQLSEKKGKCNASCDANESGSPFLFRANFPKSPSRMHSVSEKMQEMITKFNHFG